MKAMKSSYPIILLLIVTALGLFFYTFIKSDSQKKSLNNLDPQSQEILNTVVLPLCRIDQNLSRDDLPQFFTQNYIDFHDSRQTVGKPKSIKSAIRENITALSVARYDLERMFEWASAKDCDEYLSTINKIELSTVNQVDDGIDATHSFKYSYKKELNVRLKLKKTSSGWLVDFIGTEGFASLK